MKSITIKKSKYKIFVKMEEHWYRKENILMGCREFLVQDYIKLGCEVQDIDIELRVNLWDGGLTSNYFSMISDRKDIECFIYIYVTWLKNLWK